MHNLDTKTQFLELRAKGWSLARIAAKIGVSQRTLVDWNCQHREELRLLRAVELEALQEKVLASHEVELSRLARRLQALEQELDKREENLRYEPIRNLYHLAALIRAQIRKTRLDTDISPAPSANPAPTLAATLPGNCTISAPVLPAPPELLARPIPSD
jgi:transcriptional regulator with XRE-family HTH domain